MPSSKKSAFLTAVRVVLVGVGVGVAAMTVLKLAAMPPPPPESDGFAHGMAAIIGSVIIVLTLGLAAVGVSLPTLLGRDDHLGFNRWQCLALKGAGGLIGGGIAVGLAYGFTTELQYGIILWLGLVALAICVVCATVVWRLTEALVRLLYRIVSEGASYSPATYVPKRTTPFRFREWILLTTRLGNFHFPNPTRLCPSNS